MFLFVLRFYLISPPWYFSSKLSIIVCLFISSVASIVSISYIEIVYVKRNDPGWALKNSLLLSKTLPSLQEKSLSSSSILFYPIYSIYYIYPLKTLESLISSRLWFKLPKFPILPKLPLKPFRDFHKIPCRFPRLSLRLFPCRPFSLFGPFGP